VSRVLRPAQHSIGHFGDGLCRQNASTHNNETKSLTTIESLTFMKHKTLKQRKPKNVRTANSKCAYVTNSECSSNNLPMCPPDSQQCQNAVYWRMKSWHI